MGKNVIIFGVDMSSSAFTNNKIKDILILGKGPAQGLDDTRFTAEAQYSLGFSRSNKNVPLSLIIMGAPVSSLLMLQKYINSKQKVLK